MPGGAGTSPPGASDGARSTRAGEQMEAARQLVAEHAEVVRQLHAEHARILQILREELDRQRGELDGAQQQIQVLSGRTGRHEAGQQLARDATRELEALRERMETESAQRRELAQRILLFIERERASAAERESAQHGLIDRTRALEEKTQIEGDQVRRLLDDAATRGAADAGIAQRLAGAESVAAAERDATHRAAAQVASLVSAAGTLRGAVDDVVTRLGVIAAEQRQLGEEVGSLRASRREDSDLLDVIEQQRTHRHRLEARLAEFEDRLVEQSSRFDAQQQDVALARAEVAGVAERLGALTDLLEGQREAVLEHVRQSALAQQEAARRHSAELDRDVRVAKELLARFAEAPDRAAEEQAEEDPR